MSLHRDPDAQKTHLQLLREGVMTRCVDAFGNAWRPGPSLHAVTFAQPSAFAQITLAWVVDSHHHLDTPLFEHGDEGVGAKSAVSHQDVPWVKELEGTPRHGRIMDTGSSFDGGQPRSWAQIKEAHQLHKGKAAAFFWLGPQA
jgi:hypothetical protein